MLRNTGQPVRTAYAARRTPQTARGVQTTSGAGGGTQAPPKTPPIVSSGFANLDQYLFAIGLAAKTGLSLRVIFAWIHAEEPASADPSERGHNWLNVGVGSAGGPKGAGYGWSGVRLAGTGNPGYKFANVKDAITETAYWINSMSNYATIKRSAGESDANQLSAIANSPWDAGHYNGGASLRAAYGSEPGQGSSSVFGDVAGWLGGGLSSGGSAVVDAGKAVVSGAVSVSDFLGMLTDKVFWIRFAFVIVGLSFGLIGVVMLFRAMGVSSPIPPAALAALAA